MMRVLQVPPRYAPYIGGVEAVAQATAEGLVRAGHRCEVVCADVPRGAASIVGDVTVHRLRAPLSIANTQITIGLPWWLWRASYDVVHAHLPTPWSADWAIIVGKLRRRRTVLTVYNEIVGGGVEAPAAWLYRTTVQRLTLALADALIVQSPTRARYLAARHPRIAAKIVTIPNGVDTRTYCPPVNRPESGALLFVARLDRFHRYKGLEVLIRAMVDVSGELEVVGDGELLDEYRRYASAYGVEERITFRGDVGAAELLTLYQTCSVFVLPSSVVAYEGGSSLVVLEAMSCGMPVIVADGAGDIAEEVQRVGCGLRVPAADSGALASAIRSLEADPDARTAMGSAGREYVARRRSWDRIVEAYVDVYDPEVRLSSCGPPRG